MAALLGAVAFTACDKNAVQVITAPVAGSYVRFANFGVSAPGVNFYANDAKLSAISATGCVVPTDPLCATTGLESTTGVASGAYAIASGLYFSVVPGQYTLTGRIAAATDKNLSVSTATSALDDGKYYTFYISGKYNTTAKTVEGFVIEDPIGTTVDYTVARVRFVNAIAGSNPGALGVGNTTTSVVTVIGTAPVAYKSGSAFTSIPGGVYDIAALFPVGTGSTAVARTGVSFLAGRTYTVTARGDITATTGTTVPTLDNTANR